LAADDEGKRPKKPRLPKRGTDSAKGKTKKLPGKGKKVYGEGPKPPRIGPGTAQGKGKLPGKLLGKGKTLFMAAFTFMAAMPDPTDVLMLFVAAFADIALAKEAMRDRQFKQGFRTALAAALLRKEIAFSKALPYKIAHEHSTAFGERGLIEESFNRGLIMGDLFFQSLTTDQTVKLIEAGFEGLKAERYNVYTQGDPESARFVSSFARALKPAVDQIFDAAAKATATQAEERKQLLLKQQREDPELSPWRTMPKF
jgi:hypothetical protein